MKPIIFYIADTHYYKKRGLQILFYTICKRPPLLFFTVLLDRQGTIAYCSKRSLHIRANTRYVVAHYHVKDNMPFLFYRVAVSRPMLFFAHVRRISVNCAVFSFTERRCGFLNATDYYKGRSRSFGSFVILFLFSSSNIVKSSIFA